MQLPYPVCRNALITFPFPIAFYATRAPMAFLRANISNMYHVEVHPTGILAYGIGKKNSGCDFIYMGEGEAMCKSTGIVRKAHRIVRTPNKKKRKKI